MTYPSLGLRVARRAFGSLVIGLFLPDGGVIEHLALVYPCLDADDAVRGMCFGKPVVDIGAQGMQRHPTLAVPFTARNLGTVQATGTIDLDAQIAAAHRVTHRPLHRPPA